MALLAEELVEEWLNRQGYFTIRGLKVGVHEMDLLAIRPLHGDSFERRHIEVQASMRLVSYISQVPKAKRRTGVPSNSAKARSEEELQLGVEEWVHKKFDHPEKRRLRERLCSGEWTRELVVNVVRHDRELSFIEAAGVTVHRLPAVLASMTRRDHVVEAASGAHLLDLVSMAKS